MKKPLLISLGLVLALLVSGQDGRLRAAATPGFQRLL
jgi:hypothetical protein